MVASLPNEGQGVKALILDGTEKGATTLQVAGDLLSRELKNRGWEVEKILVRDLRIAPCNGCFHCWVRHPGICDQEDDSKVLTSQFVQSGLLVFITPVSFGGYGSRLKRVLERAVLPFLLPFLEKTGNETHHSLRYGRLIPLAALGGLPEADPEAETLFSEILSRNALNFHSPSHAAVFVYDHMKPGEIQDRVSALAEQVNTP